MIEFSLSDYIHCRAKKQRQNYTNYRRKREILIDRLIKKGSIDHEGHTFKTIEHLTPKCGYRYVYLACPACAKKCRKFFLNKENIFCCFKCCGRKYYTIENHISRLLFYQKKRYNQRKPLKLSERIRANHYRRIKRVITQK